MTVRFKLCHLTSEMLIKFFETEGRLLVSFMVFQKILKVFFVKGILSFSGFALWVVRKTYPTLLMYKF